MKYKESAPKSESYCGMSIYNSYNFENSFTTKKTPRKRFDKVAGTMTIQDRVYKYKAIRNTYKSKSVKTSIPNPTSLHFNHVNPLAKEGLLDFDQKVSSKSIRRNLQEKEQIKTTETLRQVAIYLEQLSKKRDTGRFGNQIRTLQKPVKPQSLCRLESTLVMEKIKARSYKSVGKGPRSGYKKISLRKTVLLREHYKKCGKRVVLSPNESYV